MFIILSIKSKNINSLNKFLSFFIKLCSYKRFKLIFLTKHLNNKNFLKTFTVLKSPHVNKKSGEKFEFRLYCKQFFMYSFENIKFLIMLKNQISELFPDIVIEIKFLVNNCKLKRFKKLILNPNNFLIKTTTTNKYLKIFDVFGENCFYNIKIL